MRFEPKNVGVGELAMKINNGSTDVAADVEYDFRSEARRHIILCFRAAPEENLIQNKWIGGTRSIKNVPAGPTQTGQPCGQRMAHHGTSEAQPAGKPQDHDHGAGANRRHTLSRGEYPAT